jgi:methionyl-tRNA formyltransferase
MNIVLIAEESAGIQTLRALRDTEHRIVAILASPLRGGSPGASVLLAATRLGLPVWPADLVKNAALAMRLKAEQVDIILNVHSLYIIHDEILRAPSVGAFNLHPGPLPRYAGLNAVSWAIYRGETFHGVTLHGMSPDIDAGPIVYQSLFPIREEDTALSLTVKCVNEGVLLIRRLLDTVAKGSPLSLTPQNLNEREYFGRQVPEKGRLAWDWPATKILNFVRACDYFPFRSPWGHPLTHVGTTEVGIVKAGRTEMPCNVKPGTVGDNTERGVLVASGDEWVLVKKLKIGKRYLPAKEVMQKGQHLEKPPIGIEQYSN